MCYLTLRVLSITYAFGRTSQTFVKKKAALTLLRLYRKHPTVIPAAEWALRIVSIMDDPDLVIHQSDAFKNTTLILMLSVLIKPGCRYMCYEFGYGFSPGQP